MAFPWTIYNESRDGERVWQSYKASVTGGILFRESISFLDRASGLVKCAAEAQFFIAGAPSDLSFSLLSETRDGEKLSQVYGATITGGTLYLDLTSYFDRASGLIKTVSAAMSTNSASAEGDVVSVNGETGAVELDTDDIDEGATNLYYTDDRADARVDAGIAAQILTIDSAASAGGSATESLTFTGLLATDVILALTPMTEGANPAAISEFGAPGAGSLSVTFTADPGAGAVVRALVYRAP